MSCMLQYVVHGLLYLTGVIGYHKRSKIASGGKQLKVFGFKSTMLTTKKTALVTGRGVAMAIGGAMDIA